MFPEPFDRGVYFVYAMFVLAVVYFYQTFTTMSAIYK